MIYILTAMYAEAHPFITRFQLKKDISHTRFQVFKSKDADLFLIISGTGSIPAAAAVCSICTKYGAGQGDFLLNVGICAAVGAPAASDTGPIGQVYLCNKIREDSTGKTFYPDILYRHGFMEAQVVTVPRPYVNAASATQPDTDLTLYDMESAAVYQAGSYYVGPHQMSFLKIVSDQGNPKAVTPEQMECLINRNMEAITDYITRLQAISHKELQPEPLREAAAQEWIEKLCLDLHCSRTMSESVRQYIRYDILSGRDYHSVIDEMYRAGQLPCKDKREGKKCFEELKKRLL